MSFLCFITCTPDFVNHPQDKHTFNGNKNNGSCHSPPMGYEHHHDDLYSQSNEDSKS
ncbi:hypothetical protein [Segatella copri]|uniref:hypothetical protein n=1 Tax=Segatella copri TaxID=165179 RepID=UPI0018849E7C|nr:hypothetical protein [Segatella copri]